MSTISSLGSSLMTTLNITSTQRPSKEQMFSKVDADGGLSQEEMDTMMEAEMPESPPPMPEQALATYGQNSGEVIC